MTNEIELKIESYPKQKEFVLNKEFLSLLLGGIGSGKTYAGAQKSLSYSIENLGANGIVSAPTYKLLNEATIPCYQEVFPDYLIKKFTRSPYPTLDLSTGGKIYFWSTSNPKLIAGITCAFVHMDEGSLSPYQSYLAFRERMRQQDKTGLPYPWQLWITTTPRQLNWLYHEVTSEERPIKYWQVSTTDNIFLADPKTYIRNTGIKEGTKEYEQEILGKFVSLEGECLFDDTTLERILNEIEQPLERRKYIDVYRLPVVGANYVAGSDCADEGGGGVNSLIIMDSKTGIEMAEINANIRADKYADMVFQLCAEYNYPLLAVERNGTAGGMVIQKLKDLGYPNIYVDDKDKEGWYTSAKAIPPKIGRHQMLLEYEEAVRTRQTIVCSSDAVGEFSTFVRDEKGIYNHREGCRDDRIFARAICWQMARQKLHRRSSFIATKRLATSYV